MLKLKIKRLNAAFADGNLNVDEFKELKNPLLPKRVEIEEKIVALQTTRGNRLEPLRSWILEANQAAEWAEEKNWVEMKSFLRRVGSNRLLRSQTLRVSYEIPWDLLAETNLAVRRAASVSEVNSLWVEARGVEPLPVTRMPLKHSMSKNVSLSAKGDIEVELPNDQGKIVDPKPHTESIKRPSALSSQGFPCGVALLAVGDSGLTAYIDRIDRVHFPQRYAFWIRARSSMARCMTPIEKELAAKSHWMSFGCVQFCRCPIGGAIVWTHLRGRARALVIPGMLN